tara:strand:+ start:290 stop:463 length:174 start_codon:yes stop_codon:yes gene_type:complete
MFIIYKGFGCLSIAKLFTVFNLKPLIFFIGCGVDSDRERPVLECFFFVHLEINITNK